MKANVQDQPLPRQLDKNGGECERQTDTIRDSRDGELRADMAVMDEVLVSCHLAGKGYGTAFPVEHDVVVNLLIEKTGIRPEIG